MAEIVQKEDPILRGKATEVPLSEIGGPKISKIIEDMKIALSREKDGVAIAAPQIGESYRIFVVTGKIFRKRKGLEKPDLIFINPIIFKKSKETELMDEGCLSVRWYYGLVKRSKKVAIKALNEKGHEFVLEKSGLLAQIFQHETDHLDGVLFIDKARDVVELPPEKQPDDYELPQI